MSPPQPPQAELVAALEACRRQVPDGFQRLQQGCLPALLAVAAHFLDAVDHREAVVHDTLLLASQNAHRRTDEAPGPWLFGILGSRLHNQLTALADTAAGPSGVGLEKLPRERRGQVLWELSQRLAPQAPGPALRRRLEASYRAERLAASLPRTPTGERVHPPLYDPRLRSKMLRSRLAYRAKMGFQHALGRPLEDLLFQRWLSQRNGARFLEDQGLPRRSVDAFLGERLDIEVEPRRLVRGFSYPAGFPERIARNKASNLFLWSGDWDQPRLYLADGNRTHFIRDLWDHRLAPERSATFRHLDALRQVGRPLRSHHKGMLLDSPERILAYLRLYLLYLEHMACFGFDKHEGQDGLGVAVDRQGGLIKINKGLHRLAMAQVLGLPRVTVRVRSVHRDWWARHIGDTTGREALERLVDSLPHCTPAA